MPANDPHKGEYGGVSAPPNDAVPVVKSDTEELAVVASSLYVGTAGDVSVQTAAGNQAWFRNVPSGGYVFCRVRRVNTATTADDILALYN